MLMLILIVTEQNFNRQPYEEYRRVDKCEPEQCYEGKPPESKKKIYWDLKGAPRAWEGPAIVMEVFIPVQEFMDLAAQYALDAEILFCSGKLPKCLLLWMESAVCVVEALIIAEWMQNVEAANLIMVIGAVKEQDIVLNGILNGKNLCNELKNLTCLLSAC
ncbi:hypothetical protein L7F22_065446 [Adiantum nelumboides]|nr:hypothetical protein [Adiantum nelumboides]